MVKIILQSFDRDEGLTATLGGVCALVDLWLTAPCKKNNSSKISLEESSPDMIKKGSMLFACTMEVVDHGEPAADGNTTHVTTYRLLRH